MRLDWRGALLLVIGTGALSTVLYQGDRLDWFNSSLICVLALVSALAIPLLLVNEWFHPLPLLKLQMLGRRTSPTAPLVCSLFWLSANPVRPCPCDTCRKSRDTGRCNPI